MWVCSRACAGKTKFGSSKFTLFPQVAKSFFLAPPQCKNLYFLKSVFLRLTRPTFWNWTTFMCDTFTYDTFMSQNDSGHWAFHIIEISNDVIVIIRKMNVLQVIRRKLLNEKKFLEVVCKWLEKRINTGNFSIYSNCCFINPMRSVNKLHNFVWLF